MVDLYYNDDHSCYAVLVSHGFGAGWSSWNAKEIAYDKRVIEWYLEHNSYEFCNKVNLYSSFSGDSESPEHAEANQFFNSLGYQNTYFGGYKPNMLEWVPVNAFWRIKEYDGSESIEFRDDGNWNFFGGRQ
jgi:beta-glucanase (GH16 family)